MLRHPEPLASSGLRACPAGLRAKPNFMNRIKLFLPVQFRSQKYSASRFTQITFKTTRPAHSEGRFAIVTDVGAGCDGRGSAFDEQR
jgi:hypothetical protein